MDIIFGVFILISYSNEVANSLKPKIVCLTNRTDGWLSYSHFTSCYRIDSNMSYMLLLRIHVYHNLLRIPILYQDHLKICEQVYTTGLKFVTACS